MNNSAFRRSTPQVFGIGSQRFIAGLLWQSLSRPTALAEEAADIAKELRFDLMVTLHAQGGVAQAGFADSSEGGVTGAASIAAVIASRFLQERVHSAQMTASCIGAFELPDHRWLYIAIRDSVILPQGDFIGTRAEVLEQLEKDFEMGEWDVVFGDASFKNWGIDHFQVRALDEMLPRKKSGAIDIKKPFILKQINFEGSRGVYRRFGAIAALALALAGSSYGYYKWDQARKAEAAAAEAARRAAEEAALAGGQGTPKSINPWVPKPAPQAFAQACIREFKYISLGAWQLGQFVCTPSSVSYQWIGDTWANPASVLSAVPAANVDLVGGKANYSAPLALEGGGDDTLGELHSQLVGMATFFRTAGFEFRFGASGGQPQRAWQQQAFTVLLGTLNPVPVVAAIDSPGIRIEKIAYQNGEWQMEGTIYAN